MVNLDESLSVKDVKALGSVAEGICLKYSSFERHYVSSVAEEAEIFIPQIKERLNTCCH